jgi:CheY-like chemotaxis protein
VVFRSCHPLIVDDDPDFVLLLKRCLVKLGVPGSQIQACPDGNAALKLLCMKDFAPSLVILDHKMPMLTGLEVLEWIRSQESLSSLCVFIFSTGSESDLVRRTSELGAEGYFVKPMGLEELQSIIGSMPANWKARKRGENVPGSVDPVAR